MFAAIVVILALASQGLLAVRFGPAEVTDSALQTLCNGKSPGEITMDQIGSFAKQLKGWVSCKGQIKSAIRDLDQLLEQGKADACTKDYVDQCEGYFYKHMQGHGVPKSLVMFALSYYSRLAQRCKINMIETLTGDATKLLTAQDLDLLKPWTNEGGDIDRVVTENAKKDGFLLHSDLAKKLPYIPLQQFVTKLNSQLVGHISHVKDICAKRFRPVYAPATEAVVAWAHAGFGYPEESARNELAVSAQQAKQLDEFYRIIFLCELMNSVDEKENGESTASQGPVQQVVYKPTPVSAEGMQPLPAAETQKLYRLLYADNLVPT